jgi:DNA-directed RNA polymerase specialized sigma24 family protein
MPVVAGAPLVVSSVDDSSFVPFARRVLPSLMSLLQRVAPPGADVEDLAAEALARAFGRWSRLGRPSSTG